MIATPPPRLLSASARAARGREAGVLVLLLCAGYVTNPDRPLPFDVCLWHRLTGWSCPTCGLTRAVCHALHGDWAGSLQLHIAGPAALLMLTAWAARATVEAWRGRPLSIAD